MISQEIILKFQPKIYIFMYKQEMLAKAKNQYCKIKTM